MKIRKRREAQAARQKSLSARIPFSRMQRLPQLQELEKMLIQEAMGRFSNKTKMARVLGITREGLRKKIIRFNLAVPGSE